MTNAAALSTIAIVIPAVLIAVIPRRWIRRAMGVWLVSPAFVLAGIMLSELTTAPPMKDPFGTFTFGFMLIATIGILPWIASCLVGFGFGLAFRRLLHGHEKRAAPPAAPAAEPETFPPRGDFGGGLDERSPDGRFAVGWMSHRWFGNYQAWSPTIAERATGRPVIDLSAGDWDVRIAWDGGGHFRLRLAGEHHPLRMTLFVDADRRTFAIDDSPAMPLAEARVRIAAETRAMVHGAAGTVAPTTREPWRFQAAAVLLGIGVTACGIVLHM